MRIIGGIARNIVLDVPPGLNVRPTAARSRKGLFDSLSPFLSGCRVLDLFAGSGALALEAASRGAVSAHMVELDSHQLSAIERNVAKVRKAGVSAELEVLRGDASEFFRFGSRCRDAALIFSDPPYAKSAEYFHKLLENAGFLKQYSGALLVWELPDTPGATGEFLHHLALPDYQIRNFGGTDFLIGHLK